MHMIITFKHSQQLLAIFIMQIAQAIVGAFLLVPALAAGTPPPTSKHWPRMRSADPTINLQRLATLHTLQWRHTRVES
jgi:hypothetical protein